MAWFGRVVVLALLGCMSVGAPRASAQAGGGGGEPRGYRELIDRAIAADEGGKFEEARTLFGRAHALYPNARTFRGLGMVEFELGNYTSSADVLQRALASKVRPLDAKLRSATEELLAKAHGFIGRYIVSAQPPASSVMVDGADALRNAYGEVLIAQGEHQLEVSAPGYRSETRPLSVKGGERETLSISLTNEGAIAAAAPAVAAPAAEPGRPVSAQDLGQPPAQQPPPPTYAWPGAEPEAQRPPSDAGAEQAPGRQLFYGNERRHTGFMFRFELGLGYAAMRLAGPGAKLVLSGLDGMVSFDIGGSIADNLVLHLRLSAISITSPTLTIGGRSVSTEGRGDVVASSVLIGPALTYYIMPINVYITGALGLARVVLEVDGDEATTKFGWGLNVDVGKEWWASDDWGLGVGAQFWYSAVHHTEAGTAIDVASAGIQLLGSATWQ